jgi:hypothetical protein
MALSWSLEEVSDWQSLKNETEGVITDALIWYTMFVGVNRITETSWTEFYARIKLWERMYDPSMSRIGEDGTLQYINVTPEMVRRRIGMFTNASTLTRLQFLKSVGGALDEYVKEAERDGGRTSDA